MIPRYGEWERRYRDRGLSVVGVHTPETEGEADPEKIREFVMSRGIGWPVVLDPYHEVWRRYGADAWPTVILIDRDGLVRATFVGDDRHADIAAALTELLGG